jgi:hypothetical protein
MKSRSAGAATLPKAFKGARPIGQVDPDLIFTAIIVAILATIPTALIAQVARSSKLSLDRVPNEIKTLIEKPIKAIKTLIGKLINQDQPAQLRTKTAGVWSAKEQSFIRYGAFVMVILSSLLVALWDGVSEGLTAMIAVALTALLGFLVLDVTSIKIGWSLSGSTRPRFIFASKPLFLALITVSLVISWALDLASPIIFAALLFPLAVTPPEVDSSHPPEVDSAHSLAEDQQKARFERFSSLTLLSIGLLAWGCYTFLWYQPQPTSLANLFMWISAALTCQALATLPLTLLPVRFLPGQQIFKERFIIWILLFLASLIMFAIAFLPEDVTPLQFLPGDLGRESVSVDAAGPWQTALIAYCVLGVLIWLAAYFWPREKPSAKPLEAVTNRTP